MFEPNTTFLICSDGITRHIDDFELRDLLLSSDKPANIVQKMKEICYERGAEDNLTAVIAKVSNSTVADNLNGSKNKIPSDFEEATIAAARPPVVVNDAIFSENSLSDETQTQNFQFPVLNNQNCKKLVISVKLMFPKLKINEIRCLFRLKIRLISLFKEMKFSREDRNYFAEEKSEKSVFGKILSPLLTLLLGTLFGAGIYHLWAQKNVEPQVPQLVQQSPDIPYKSFEDNRRNVDRNPQQYHCTNTAPPQDAEDFYLLGRAYLLTGKFPKLKNALYRQKIVWRRQTTSTVKFWQMILKSVW